jgi:2-dehydro-3-deoxy-D-arabinonate dehydratase
MPLCRYQDTDGPRLGWVDIDAQTVAPLSGTLAELLRRDPPARSARLAALRAEAPLTQPLAETQLLAPVDAQEVWAAGVTYERSRDARMEESSQQDVYDKVYDAQRPELFFKAAGWRCVGPDAEIAIRDDSDWDVPEPELAVVLDAFGVIAGYTVGNDVSSRSIEGENPLYLPQAKMFADSCALGPWIMLPDELPDVSELGIALTIERADASLWESTASTRQLHRTLTELIAYLYRALEFPDGAVLLTGTPIVPPSEFTLKPGDVVRIGIDGIGSLTNPVRRLGPAATPGS